jgi:hypothetical protein
VEGIAYDIPDPAIAKEELHAIVGDLVAMIQEGYLKICSIVKAG